MYFSIINLLMAISFFAASIVAVFLIFRSQHVASKVLACAGFATAFWILLSIIYRNIGAIDKNSLLFIARMQYVAGAALMTLYLFFVYAFTHGEKRGRQKKLFATVWGAPLFLFLVLTIFTNTMIKDVEVFQGARVMVYGYLYPAYVLYMIALAVAGYYYLIGRLWLSSEKLERAQLIYILIGSTLTLVTSFVVDIVLPIFQIQFLLWLGPVSAIFFFIFALYAILRHHLFETHVITTEFLVFAILITVFIQIFLAGNFQEALLNTLLFLAAGFFSIFLLRSVYVEIEQREKIERLAQRLSDAISFAAHELRTPVTKFRGYVSMLLDGDFGELQPEIKKSLEACFSAAAEMNGNIETFLNLNRLEAGKLEVREQKVDLQEIVADCLADFNPKAKEKNIVLVFQKKDRLPEVLADKLQIRHVINNLISNAIKYTSENGMITVQLDEDKKSKDLIFTIEDTGIGIPRDVLPRLFSRYERGGERAKSISEGSGIGLFLAKEIIEMHHGRIWAESRGGGKGSRFSFSLSPKPADRKIGGQDIKEHADS